MWESQAFTKGRRQFIETNVTGTLRLLQDLARPNRDQNGFFWLSLSNYLPLTKSYGGIIAGTLANEKSPCRPNQGPHIRPQRPAADLLGCYSLSARYGFVPGVITRSSNNYGPAFIPREILTPG